MNNRKQNFVSVPEFDIIIIEDFDKRMKQRNAAKTLRRDYKLYHMSVFFNGGRISGLCRTLTEERIF